MACGKSSGYCGRNELDKPKGRVKFGPHECVSEGKHTRHFCAHCHEYF